MEFPGRSPWGVASVAFISRVSAGRLEISKASKCRLAIASSGLAAVGADPAIVGSR
jgi:hypothetical protein